MREAAGRRRVVLSLLVLALGIVPATSASGAGKRPFFQAPFPCGQRWYASTRPGHNAIDWSRNPGDGNNDAGAAVVASAGGTATIGTQFYSNGTGYGYFVLIDHGDGWKTRYAHLQKAGRVSGRVALSQRIGYLGNSGTSSAHLHWEQLRDEVRQRPLYANGAAVGTSTYHRSKNCPSPLGKYKRASSPEAGTVRVTGWAIDPSAPRKAVGIRAYVGGRAGAAGAEKHKLGGAKLPRPGVGRAYPHAGKYHGFDRTLTTGKTGTQRVCVYAVDIGLGRNTKLGCKTVTIEDPDPFGGYDSADSSEPGTVSVTGWAIDPNAMTGPVTIHASVGGTADAPGVEHHDLGLADLSRPDVAAAHPAAGDLHGFDRAFETAMTGIQPVCIYAINIGAGADALLGCETVDVLEGDSASGR